MCSHPVFSPCVPTSVEDMEVSEIEYTCYNDDSTAYVVFRVSFPVQYSEEEDIVLMFTEYSTRLVLHRQTSRHVDTRHACRQTDRQTEYKQTAT